MGYSTRQFCFEDDRDSLFALWKAVIQNPDPQRMVRMYTDNSYGTPISWLVLHGEALRPVGSVSAFPSQINVDGRVYKYGINCDMLLLKKHRTLGPVLIALKSLIKSCREQGYHFLLSMPNEKSQPVFKRAGYEKIGTAYRWSKVLRSEEKVARYVKSAFLKKIIIPCSDLCLRVVSCDLWMKFRHHKLWSSICVEQDGLISETDFAELLFSSCLPNKSPAFLQWRYSANLCFGNPSLFLVADDRKITGFVIYTVKGKEVIVQDVTIVSENSVETSLLLSKFINKMRERGYMAISLLHFGPEDFEKLLHRFGFIKREGRDLFVNNLSVNKTDSNFPLFLKKISWFEGDVDL